MGTMDESVKIISLTEGFCLVNHGEKCFLLPTDPDKSPIIHSTPPINVTGVGHSTGVRHHRASGTTGTWDDLIFSNQDEFVFRESNL